MSDKDIHEEELVDLGEDHCDQDELVGCEIKAPYENRWFVGDIKYLDKINNVDILLL